MNILIHALIAAGALLALCGNARADDPTPEPAHPTASTLTRHQVSEAMRATRLATTRR